MDDIVAKLPYTVEFRAHKDAPIQRVGPGERITLPRHAARSLGLLDRTGQLLPRFRPNPTGATPPRGKKADTPPEMPPPKPADAPPPKPADAPPPKP